MFMRHSPNVFEISQSELNCSIFHGTDLYRHIISNSHVNGYLAHRDLPTDLSDWNGLNGHKHTSTICILDPFQVLLNMNLIS